VPLKRRGEADEGQERHAQAGPCRPSGAAPGLLRRLGDSCSRLPLALWRDGVHGAGAEEEDAQEVRKALDDGKKVRAKATVEARKAGKVETAKRTIRLVK
jgi:hypothetical protein